MKKLSYILSGLLIAGSSAFFSSCGDNKDFWGPHTLTDDEIAERSVRRRSSASSVSASMPT